MITVTSVNGKSVRATLEIVCTDNDILPTNATGGFNGYRLDNGSIAQVLSTSGAGLRVFMYSSDEDAWFEM